MGNEDSNKSNNSRTGSALNMLTCILQRVALEATTSVGYDAEYYDYMAGIAIALTDAINQVENNGKPIQNNQLKNAEEEIW